MIMEKNMLIHHIGYYVTDIEATKKQFEWFGYVAEKDLVYDSQRGIKVLFLIGCSVRIELIEIVDRECCDITHMQWQKGACPYHICYEVENIDLAVEKLKEKRLKVIRRKSKAVAIENRDIVFIYGKNIGIIELIER